LTKLRKNKTLLFSDHGPSTNSKFAREFITLELYFKGEIKFHAQAQALDPFVLALAKTEPAMEKHAWVLSAEYIRKNLPPSHF
jgi:hypothetical protein